MMKACRLAVAASFAALAASPALAEATAPPGPLSYRDLELSSDMRASATAIPVSYADLNVSTAEGVGELQSRITAAARRVCAASRYRITIDRRALYEACVRDSTRDALRRAESGEPAGRFMVQVRRAPAPGSP